MYINLTHTRAIFWAFFRQRSSWCVDLIFYLKLSLCVILYYKYDKILFTWNNLLLFHAQKKSCKEPFWPVFGNVWNISCIPPYETSYTSGDTPPSPHMKTSVLGLNNVCQNFSSLCCILLASSFIYKFYISLTPVTLYCDMISSVSISKYSASSEQGALSRSLDFKVKQMSMQMNSSNL
jgi:hypothetical protein